VFWCKESDRNKTERYVNGKTEGQEEKELKISEYCRRF
jgi:hypothetical protein